jgi:PQQ-like domain
MMNKRFLYLLFLFFVFTSKAQQVPFKELTIGQFHGSDKPLKAIEYTLADRVFRLNYDSTNQQMSILLRGVRNDKWLKNLGQLVVLNTETKKTVWTDKMNYVGQHVLQINDMIVKYSGKSELLNPQNGRTLWSNTVEIIQVDRQKKIGLGYGLMKQNRLFGVDLATGEDMWHRDIPRDYGWNGSYQPNDSTIIILASGVHFINLKTGKGWDVEMATGKKDYSGTVATNIAGAALGLLTGTFMYSTGHNTVTGLSSNALIKEDKIYVASKKNLICLDFNGKERWITPMPKDSMSKSSIFIRDSTLYMVNHGYAYFNGKEIPFGKSFIAAFDLATGKTQYLDAISGVDVVEDIRLDSENIVLLAKDKLLKYELQSGKLITDIVIKNSKEDPLTNFVGNQVFENKDSVYQSIVLSDTSNLVVATKKNILITFDKNLNAVKEQNFDQLYVKKKEWAGGSVLTSKNDIIFLDANNKAKAFIKGEYLPYFTANKLFLAHEKTLIEINLADIQ